MKTIIKFILLFIYFELPILFVNGQTLDWKTKANPTNNPINGVAFSADGQKVLSGTDCHPASIRIYETTTGATQWDYTVGSSYMCIMGVTFSANSNYIAAIEEMGNILIFNNTNTPPTLTTAIHTGTSYGFSTAISPTNDKVAVGCSNGKLKVYNLAGGTLSNDINAHPSWVTTVAYSPDGNFIVTGGSDSKVKVWNTLGYSVSTCLGHTGQITSVKVTPDNQFVISASQDNTIKVWNLLNGTLVKTITGHTDDVNGVDISPNGTKIVSGSADNSCKIWDFNTGALISTFGVMDSGVVRTVAWSPNGDKIASGNEKSDIMLWTVSSPSDIEQANGDKFVTLYPNPTRNTLHIDLKNVIGKGNIKVYSALGQLEIEQLNSEFTFLQTFDVSSLNNGVHFLQIQTDKGTFTRKFIIE